MTTYGGSHTNFDAGAFSAGAVGGATALATALLSGCAAARAANWATWNRDALLAGIEFGELRRAELYDALTDANRTISQQEREITALRTELRVAQARRR
jgi:hypothetical protein